MSLPSGWKLVKLADIAAKQPNALVDGPFGSNLKVTDYVNDGVPVLQGKNITGNKFQWFDVRFISEKKAHSLKRSLVKEGDILIVKIGSIGYSAQIDSLHGYPHAMIPANLCKLTPDLSIIDPSFLVYYLNSNDSVDYLRSNASATSQPALSLGKIKELPVPLPPLTEQKRIASLLARADRLRQLRRTAHDLGDALLQSVFLEMFGDPKTNPKKWDVFELGEIVDINPSGRAKASAEQPTSFLPMTLVEPGNIFSNVLDVKRFDEISTGYTYFEENDVLFAKITPCMENGNIVIAKNLLNGFGFGSTEFHVIRQNEKANAFWLHGLVNRPEFREEATRWFRGTAGQQRVPSEFLESYRVPLPPLSLQEEFAGVVARVESLRGRMGESTRGVEGLFESLLAQSFSGVA
ncbi:MAG: restriction endonuclease subunit S [Anaerolineales bacterium]